jgi:hypothetical protein
MIIIPISKNYLIAILVPILFSSINVVAADIDEIANYKPSEKSSKAVAQPYSNEELIGIVSKSIDNNGVYVGPRPFDYGDPRLAALNESLFGRCDGFYLKGNWAKDLVDYVLDFNFPKDEATKNNGAMGYNSRIKSIKEDYIDRMGPGNTGCDSKSAMNRDLSKLIGVLNSISLAAPRILQEKHSLLEREKAEKDAAEASEAKISICKNTKEYKIYESSEAILSNRKSAAEAKQEIEKQEAVAKISGFVDKGVMYKMGTQIATANRYNKENFDFYKKIGGTAGSIESVPRIADPCKR